MADRFDVATRSRVMARVGRFDTPPERMVRSLLHRMGLRFRLHRKDLPGRPDVVLPRHRTVVFVHGCFWHQHRGCRRSVRPTSNVSFWNAKLDRNVRRDRLATARLRRAGWSVLVIWECQTRNPALVRRRIARFFGLPVDGETRTKRS